MSKSKKGKRFCSIYTRYGTIGFKEVKIRQVINQKMTIDE